MLSLKWGECTRLEGSGCSLGGGCCGSEEGGVQSRASGRYSISATSPTAFASFRPIRRANRRAGALMCLTSELEHGAVPFVRGKLGVAIDGSVTGPRSQPGDASTKTVRTGVFNGVISQSSRLCSGSFSEKGFKRCSDEGNPKSVIDLHSFCCHDHPARLFSL